MHSQRCPVAKLRAASQQRPEVSSQVNKHKTTKISLLPSVFKRVTGRKKERLRRGTRSQSARDQERTSFSQRLYGDAAPRLPPRPQMYSDDSWRPSHLISVSPVTHQVYYNEAAHKMFKKRSGDDALIYNENCAVHGRNSSRLFGMSKSTSCPVAAKPQPSQSVSGERLKNWRRNSFTFTATKRVQSGATAEGHTETVHRSVSLGNDLQSFPSTSNQKSKPRKSTSMSSSLSSAARSSASLARSNTSSDDADNRRWQFRRAWSFFSAGCDERRKGKPPPQKILRQPTRHVYRRGISGLPVECTNRSLGVAF
ncbi:uncharacterized protein [Procambarus clarkii]|uniref:uncharacterized protein n=1 Tax=Procambarus clarkii TaxID=6728 RepID=UPI001E67434D|nr:uncharacterized protein LOC123747501 [Procambarus clarkii]